MTVPFRFFLGSRHPLRLSQNRYLGQDETRRQQGPRNDVTPTLDTRKDTGPWFLGVSRSLKKYNSEVYIVHEMFEEELK